MPYPSRPARQVTSFAPFQNRQTEREALDAWLSTLRVEPIHAWSWDCEIPWSLGPRKRANDHLWFIESGSGSGWFDTPDHAFRFRPGDLLVFPQERWHMLEAAAGPPLRVHTLHLHATVHGGVNLVWLLGLAGAHNVPTDCPVQALVDNLSRENALRPAGWQASMAADLTHLLLALLDAANLDFSHALKSGDALARLLPALRLIDSQLDDPDLTVGELAQAAHISENHLRNLFRKALQMSPAAFLRKRRIAKACTLLLCTDLSIKTVAARCGYRHPQVFFSNFKQVAGTTPKAYRKEKEPDSWL